MGTTSVALTDCAETSSCMLSICAKSPLLLNITQNRNAGQWTGSLRVGMAFPSMLPLPSWEVNWLVSRFGVFEALGRSGSMLASKFIVLGWVVSMGSASEVVSKRWCFIFFAWWQACTTYLIWTLPRVFWAPSRSQLRLWTTREFTHQMCEHPL